MIRSRYIVILTHLGVGIIGLIIGVATTYWLETKIWQAGALATYGIAIQADDAGRQDEAAILLSQATIEDPNNYAPLALLGDIYLHKGNQELALTLYKKALMVADRQSDVTHPELESIQNNITNLEKQSNAQHHAPPT